MVGQQIVIAPRTKTGMGRQIELDANVRHSLTIEGRGSLGFPPRVDAEGGLATDVTDADQA